MLIAAVGLVRAGFGLDWYRTLHGAWLVLRASQLWAPYPDNDPRRARACVWRFYALVRLCYGEPAHPAKAAGLEVDWWRVHRAGQYGMDRARSTTRSPARSWWRRWPACTATCTASRRPRSGPAAVHRARAMDLSDQWVREGCQPDSRLLPLEHAALVRSYAALLAAVHR